MLVPYKFDSFNQYLLAGLLEMRIHKFKFYLFFFIKFKNQLLQLCKARTVWSDVGPCKKIRRMYGRITGN